LSSFPKEKLQKERETPQADSRQWLTGHGLKDPDTVSRVSKEPLRIEADLRSVEKVIKEIL